MSKPCACCACRPCRSACAVCVNEGNGVTTAGPCTNSRADNGHCGGGDEQPMDPRRSKTASPSGFAHSLRMLATTEPCSTGCQSQPACHRTPFAIAILCGNLWLGFHSSPPAAATFDPGPSACLDRAGVSLVLPVVRDRGSSLHCRAAAFG